MKDIASKLNISINAVSLALNDRVGISEDTRVLVIKTALWRINNIHEPYVKIGMEVTFIERESVKDLNNKV